MGARLYLTALAALALAVSLGACGDDDEDTATAGVELSLESCEGLEYGGDGEPDALIVSDLPMQGDSAERSSQQVEAIRLALEESDWRAGEQRVAFQACDDSIESTGLWDPERCRGNAEAYADHEPLLGVIGTYNSGCAEEMIPILNEGNLAMVSPGNTMVCLTERSSTCEKGEPDSLYPSGERNYLRVVPNDAFQGAGLVQFTRQLRANRPFVLHTVDDATSEGQAANYVGAAAAGGLLDVPNEAWDPEAESYRELFERVKRDDADAVVLAGLIEHNGAQLIQDKVDVLGTNEEVPLLAFDGFSQQSTIDLAGDAAAGMYAAVTGRDPQALRGPGQDFVEALEERLDTDTVELYAPYTGEAAQVMLSAISVAGADRAGVVEALFDTNREKGILGPYVFTPSGDPSVGQVTIYRAADAFERDTEVSPPPALVRAARG